MYRRAIKILLSLVLFLYGHPQTGQAGTTGKITGQVTDTEGIPLPGASVIIEGTRQGSEADEEGIYFLLSVTPGRYTLLASMVGHASRRRTEVLVSSDFTTNVSFELEGRAIGLREVVVEARAGSDEWGMMTAKADEPAVNPNRTSSKFLVTAEDIAVMPVVKDVASLAGLQPGVQADGRSVRGGNFSMDEATDWKEGQRVAGWYTTTPKPVSITYTVDGVRMVNNDARSANMFNGVNRASIQEISVVTGVPEAEYGNMDAGIINIVTKEGGRDYRGFGEYRYTLPGQRHFGFHAYDPNVHIDPKTGRSRIRFRDPNWLLEREEIGPDGVPGTEDDTGRLVHVQPDDYTEVSGHRLEGSVSGPIGSKVSFHVSALTDRQPTLRPNPALRDLPNVQVTSKFTFDLGSQIHLKVGGVFGRRQNFRSIQNTALSDGRDIYQPAKESDGGKESVWNAMGYAVLTHALSPRTMYELRLSRFDTEWDTVGVPEDTGRLVRDADGWFTVRRAARDFRLNRQTRYNLKFDLSGQVTKENFLKVGIEATWYRTWQWEERSRGTGKFQVWTIIDNFEAAKYPYGKDGQIDFVPVRGGTVNIPDWSAAGTLDDPAWNGYRDYPRRGFQFSAYAQDKMEFEGMVVNVGLRLDSFFHRGKVRPEPLWYGLPQNRRLPDAQAALFRQSQNPYPGDPTSLPVVDGNDMLRVLPRFGVSHPITDRSSIHFSYGRFFVLPIFYAMYGQTWLMGFRTPPKETARMDLNGDGRLSSYEYHAGVHMGSGRWGSAHVRPASTGSYEVGADWNFVTDYTATATMFYRRAEDYLQQNNPKWNDPAEKKRVNTHWYKNAYSGETRGLEVAVKKRFSNTFSFQATYTWYRKMNVFSASKHIRDWYPDSNFLKSGAYRHRFDIDPETGERIWKPLTEHEIQTLGAYADRKVRKAIDGLQEEWRISVSEQFAGQVFGPRVGLPIIQQEKNVAWTSFITGNFRGPARNRDVPSDGNITFLFATPPDFGPTFRRLHFLGDLNVNLLLRIQPGFFFEYEVSTPSPSTRGQLTKNRLMFRNPTAFTIDLGVQKGFQAGRLHPVLFFEATNLFNAKKPKPINRFFTFNNIPVYGLAENQPTPDFQRLSHLVWDPWTSYQNRSREIYFGVRVRM